MQSFTHYIPTDIRFGAGRLNDLATLKLPGRKALIVISSGKSMRANGYLERVAELLKKNGVDSVVFDKILPNPVKAHVMEGAALAKESKCDFVIGLGGGSSIDSAKAIAVMANNPGDYWDYVAGGSGKALPVPNPALPIVAITTTAGTGTEADPWTVITNGEEKIGFGYAETFPAISIVDPELMLSVPPALTAYQGFDALFHSMEGYLANIATPVSDVYALKSIALVAKYLPVAVKDGANLEARGEVALANTLAGMVESTSCCTSEHSLAHALSGLFPKLAHGAALIMLSLAYWKFFAAKEPERSAEIARAMGGDCVVGALKQLQEACGVADLKMSDYGIARADLPKIARNAYDTMGGLFALDRYQLSFEETLAILEEAYR